MAVEHTTFANTHLSEKDIKLRYILSAFEDKGWGKVNLETEYINI